MAFRRQNEESFLEAVVHTFSFFEGVPQKVIFDNGKVLVEDFVGWALRNTLVPVPRIEDLAALNLLLRECCIAYRSRKIQGKNGTVDTMFSKENAALRPLPEYPLETNSYSVPHEYTENQVGVKVYAEHAVWTAVGKRFGSVSNRQAVPQRLLIALPYKWLTFVFMLALLPERRVLLVAVNPTEEQIKLLARPLESHTPKP